MKVNGKEYPMWSQFVERKKEWIGGILEDHDMGEIHATKITDIDLRPTGEDLAFFEVIGKEFGCGFRVDIGGIGKGDDGWITFYGYQGHKWRIKKYKKGE